MKSTSQVIQHTTIWKEEKEKGLAQVADALSRKAELASLKLEEVAA